MTFGISRVDLEVGDSTRSAFGEALAEAGADERVVVVDGDVNNSTYTNKFKAKYPDRFFNAGIAESNLIGIAAGLAASGKIPVVSSFSTFLLSNAFDQIRMSVAFPYQNVKLVGTHAGISIGEDGPSQMAIEDVAQACAFPGMTVIVPADAPSARAATQAMIEREGPTFLRCGRPNVPVVYPNGPEMHVGHGEHRPRRRRHHSCSERDHGGDGAGCRAGARGRRHRSTGARLPHREAHRQRDPRAGRRRDQGDRGRGGAHGVRRPRRDRRHGAGGTASHRRWRSSTSATPTRPRASRTSCSPSTASHPTRSSTPPAEP